MIPNNVYFEEVQSTFNTLAFDLLRSQVLRFSEKYTEAEFLKRYRKAVFRFCSFGIVSVVSRICRSNYPLPPEGVDGFIDDQLDFLRKLIKGFNFKYDSFDFYDCFVYGFSSALIKFFK